MSEADRRGASPGIRARSPGIRAKSPGTSATGWDSRALSLDPGHTPTLFLVWAVLPDWFLGSSVFLHRGGRN